MKTIIIGAGLSGLAAAYRLQQNGHDVEILEADDKPGGRCTVIKRDGFIIDAGPELVSSSYERYLSLVRDVGLGEEIVLTNPIMSFVRDGKPIEVDSSKLLSAAFTPFLSWSAKFRLALGAFKLRKIIKKTSPYKLIELVDWEDPTVSAGAFSVRAFGREAADYLIDAVLRPLGGTHMNELCSPLVIGALGGWSAPMVTIRDGLYTVPIAVAQKLSVSYKTSALAVRDTGKGVEVDCMDSAGRPQTKLADRCIVATTFDNALRLYPGFVELIGDYNRRPACLLDVKLVYSKQTHSKSYVGFVPTLENADLLMYSLGHNKIPGRVPAGHSQFTVFSDHAAWDKYKSFSDEQVISWAKEQMEIFHPEIAGHFLFGHFLREANTATIADPGFNAHMARILKALSGDRRVQMAGDIFSGGSMEAAVLWGEKAAERLIVHWNE